LSRRATRIFLILYAATVWLFVYHPWNVVRVNEITEKVLPSLTAEDLKEIGVGPVGHRRTLLEAIAALRNDASGKAPLVDGATASSTQSPPPQDRANAAK
jgi:hypothetical protein